MNKIALIVLLAMVSFKGQAAERDTIDYWHVYLNDVVIAKFHQFSEDFYLEIDKSVIGKADTLSLRYGKDYVCLTCRQTLVVKNEKKQVLDSAETNKYWGKLSFELASLLATGNRLNSKQYYFYYKEMDNAPSIKMVLKVRFLE